MAARWKIRVFAVVLVVTYLGFLLVQAALKNPTNGIGPEDENAAGAGRLSPCSDCYELHTEAAFATAGCLLGGALLVWSMLPAGRRTRSPFRPSV